MIDTSTKEPIYVSQDGTAGPYIMLPVEQLDEVCAMLDNNDIRYWVDEIAISIDGDPEVTVINFYRDTQAASIQAILDSVS